MNINSPQFRNAGRSLALAVYEITKGGNFALVKEKLVEFETNREKASAKHANFGIRRRTIAYINNQANKEQLTPSLRGRDNQKLSIDYGYKAGETSLMSGILKLKGKDGETIYIQGPSI